ncbi:D-aminoacyl-tRNA deacylase [uncultured Tyzzerella sp.]|uniref:D-aminoacyl-tRNA deacylase n=1 Tax=uncultured Tyzzerella sp. TaxID=2321398 RepID=UPI002943BA17|nr:D-aminoacyl-tRNA deacylase [uncultured Tyzzerella sp.]
MRVVLQRVTKAKVDINKQTVGKIDKGIVALVAVNDTDNVETFKYMCDKIINIRIFEDDEDKLNLSIKDLNLGLLIVPNFTVYADARKGRRPSFVGGAKPDDAEKIFNDFIDYVKNNYDKVETGIFRADMQVELINDGPITILLDSDKLF